RLTHLFILKNQQPVREDPLGQRQIAGHQKGRPEDGMEAQNFLADQVQVRGPAVGSANGADIADESVEPDISDVLTFERNAPFQGGPADGEILQTAAHEADYFIKARIRLNKAGIILIMLKQLLRKRREP